MTQIDAIQKKFLAKLEQKCVGNKSLTSVLRKAFRDVDLDNDGVISFPEWARVVEVAGSVLTAAVHPTDCEAAVRIPLEPPGTDRWQLAGPRSTQSGSARTP